MHPFDPKQALMASLQQDRNKAILSFMLDDPTLEPFPISVTFFDHHPVGDMLALWNALPLITLRSLDIIQDDETCGDTPTTLNTAFVHSWFAAEWQLLLGPCSNLQTLLLQSDNSDLFLHFAKSSPLAPLPSVSNLIVNITFRFSVFQNLVYEHFREYFETRDLNNLRLPQLDICIPERLNPPIFLADDPLSTLASVSVAMDPDW